MDKNKNRTDLLAAGRKKLQQFRQKKDDKGSSSGKSSKRSGKSEQHETNEDASATGRSKGLAQVLEGENTTHVDLDSAPVDSSVLSGIDAKAGDPSCNPDSDNVQTVSVDLTIQDKGSHGDSSARDEDGVNGTHAVDKTESTTREEEKEMQLHQNPPDMSPVPARGDQVTDVGAIQMADDIGSGQSVSKCELEVQQDGTIASLDHGIIAGNFDAAAPQKTLDDANVKQPEGGAVSTPAGVVDRFEEITVSRDGNWTGNQELTSQQRDTVTMDSANVDQPNVLSSPNESGKNNEGDQANVQSAEASNEHYMPEESFVFVDNNQERPLSAELWESSESYTMPSLGDTRPITLSWLMEAIKGLSEDEYKLLLKSRDLVPDTELGVAISISSQHGLLSLLEKLKEELLLTSCTKDFLNVQLAEQSALEIEKDHRVCELANELSLLRPLLDEARQRSDGLTEELAECRSKFLATISARDELQEQLHAAEAEFKQVSLRAYELQNNLDVAKSDLFSLSKECVEFKDLVSSLQVENENLNERLALLTEEKNKLGEEKDYFLRENDKLLKELADCKNLVHSLQIESSIFTETLATVTEARKKVEDEMELLANGNLKLSSELSECKHTVEVLQLEKSNISDKLALLTEEKNELEQDKINLLNEKEGYLSECARLDDELKKVMIRLEQITEANMNLSNSLDVLKAQQREIADIEEQKSSAVRETVPPQMQEISSDSIGFVVLKGHLEGADSIIQQLEKTIEQLHSRSAAYLNRSSSNVSSPPVSKLIHAFETKAHHDEHDTDEGIFSESQPPATETLSLMKELVGKLKAVLKQLALNAETSSSAVKVGLDGRTTANLRIREPAVLKEDLHPHVNNLEAMNIELGVLFEALKQHSAGVEEKNDELKVLIDASKEQEKILQAENYEIQDKLTKYESQISELQSQLHDLRLSSDDMIKMLHDQLDDSHKEAADRVSMVERDWNTIFLQIVETVQRLDYLTGLSPSSTFANEAHGFLDLSGRIADSIDASIKMIEDLKVKLETSRTEQETLLNLFEGTKEKSNELLGRNELANGTLRKLYSDLRRLAIHSCGSQELTREAIQDEELTDLFDYNVFNTVLEILENSLNEMQQLHSANSELRFELISKANDFEELKTRSVASSLIKKLIEDIEFVVNIENAGVDIDGTLISHLESLISFLVRKLKDAALSREELGSKEMVFSGFQEKIDQLASLKAENENGICSLNERLNHAEEALEAARSQLQEKIGELEQSEQRVSSIREKLSIAVAKGKGLVVQRDALKQSLAETSSELERCSQELQSKDAQLHELDMKLSVHSESGERVEALESELSYIRHSATALRESFLLKDSVIQRIEEILEDLDMPEHFHARDIIEKVGWLARSATGNSLPSTDWEQKGSVGTSHSDSGFAIVDSWKEDTQAGSSSGGDLRRKYEELQSKFYALAEQNEMLEQSLMERNNLVQRWEEILDNINIPSHMQSMEAGDRIEWLSNALSEANNDRNSLAQKIDELESYCGSLAADLEESQRGTSYINSELELFQKRVSDLEMDLQTVMKERETLSTSLDNLTDDNGKILAKMSQFELDNEKLLNEVNGLREKLAENTGIEERIRSTDGEITRLQDLVLDALQEPGIKDVDSAGSGTEYLERVLRKLIENYTNLTVLKPVVGDAHKIRNIGGIDLIEGNTIGMLDAEESDITQLKKDIVDNDKLDGSVLKKELDETQSQLMHVKEERDRYAEMQQSLLSQVDALDKKQVELQELLDQEQQKSASLREKLNVAVRKGKSLVQQRDGLKQTIEETNVELEHLKDQAKLKEDALAEYERNMSNLRAHSERVETLESERLSLTSHVAETESYLRQREHALTTILNALSSLDVGVGSHNDDALEKLENLGKLCRDLRAAVVSSEEESRKSRRAAELLLAELNEVQERNDSLQEELAKISTEVAELSRERDNVKASKSEALSRLDKLSVAHSKERKKQQSEVMVLKSTVDQFQESLSVINNLLVGVLSKDFEYLQTLESSIESCLNAAEISSMVNVPFLSANDYSNLSNIQHEVSYESDSTEADQFDDNISHGVSAAVRESRKGMGDLQYILREHADRAHKQATKLLMLVGRINGEMISRKESFEREQEREIVLLRRNIALLYDTCINSIMEIENRKAEAQSSGELGLDLKPASFASVGLNAGGKIDNLSEEHVKAVGERLLYVLKEFNNLKSDFLDRNRKELKETVLNLQNELQKKDVERERICADLVSQIKLAEAAAANKSRDLQSAESHVRDLEQQVDMMAKERNVLQEQVKKLQDGLGKTRELQETIRSLNDILAAKDQEIDSLMQALDEEEVQMEDLKNKFSELEKASQQKDLDIENLEASRGKVLKKLSITVNKFDELHHFSESLLAEVEKLQSQLQDRDAEISFLRQEVTRCTNDVLAASQMSSKRNSDEIYQLLAWLATLISQDGVEDMNIDEKRQVDECKELLQKKLTSIFSELEDLQVLAQTKEALLQLEKSKVEELTRRRETLERSLYEKESQLNMLEGIGDSAQQPSTTSEILEIEPVINKWTAPAPSTTSQVRSLRKSNNEQVAIAIDVDPVDGKRLEDDDDDKVHGFTSLTRSRIVPRFTRPVTDLIDGLWVSCDRTLMRQPALRLGLMIYWAILHAFLATFIF